MTTGSVETTYFVTALQKADDDIQVWISIDVFVKQTRFFINILFKVMIYLRTTKWTGFWRTGLN